MGSRAKHLVGQCVFESEALRFAQNGTLPSKASASEETRASGYFLY